MVTTGKAAVYWRHCNSVTYGHFEFSDTLGILKSADLTDLVETLPLEERYTYVFEGNSQVLDHILISPNLGQNATVEYDVIHVNAEFADQVSDHDPEVPHIHF